MNRLLTIALLAFASFALAGCPEPCEDGDHLCSGDQIQTCVDGEWSDAEDCEVAGETCMTMEDGNTHCMADM